MAAVHKITEDFFEDSFTLIALHCGLEDYAMVYAINLYLKSNFKRSLEDLEISEGISFPIFDWRDEKNDRDWTLITNKSTKELVLERKDLFQDEKSYPQYNLVPEYKDVDYFIKIENDDVINDENILRSVLSIPKIVTAYTIDVDKLKSKNNLIF